MNILESLIWGKLAGGSGGGSSVPADVLRYSEQELNYEQKAQARDNIGAVSVESLNILNLKVSKLETKVETVSGTTPSITPVDNTIYQCGELTSLTITDPTASGAWSVVFTSGATAATTSIPATILGLEDFAAEANTLYEINVLDNRAVVGSWAVTASE